MAKKPTTIVKGAMITGKVDAIDFLKVNKGYPEVGQFSDEKSLQKFYKQLTQEQLDDWCKLEGLEYIPYPESPAIHRMRAAMAILYHHFPRATKAKVESPYKKYSTEDLVQMALDKDVPFEVSSDERILRMRAIMALRAHKVLV